MGSGRPEGEGGPRRLTGLDGAFLSLESSTAPLHIAGVHILDPSGVESGLDVHRVRELVASRIPRLPVLRTRVASVPLGLDHPSRVDAGDVDLTFHVRSASLARPGGPAALAALVADLLERPLDRGRPLWEFTVVEGLEHGHVALVTKVHHSLLDGMAGVELLSVLFDSDSEPTEAGEVRSRRMETGQRARAGAPGREPVPGGLDQLYRALASLPARADAFARAIDATARSAKALADWSRGAGGSLAPAPFQAPRTSVNRAISAHRRIAFAEAPLGDVQRVRSVLGGTVNDVVLAMAAGAMRTFFAGRGETPETSLVAMVPVSTRSGREPGGVSPAAGNQVSAVLVSLATGVEDPALRLRLIGAGMQAARDQQGAISSELLSRWSEVLVPAVASRISRLVTNLHVFDQLPPPFNLVVSNVPGPRTPLSFVGARMVAMYPVGPVVEGVGVNITVFTYCGTLFVGVQGCWELVPDVEVIARGMVDALAELGKEADRRDRPVPWWHGDRVP